MKHCLVFASLISPSKMILFEKKYQTFDTVFHHQMKHLEVRQKYSAARRIFNSLLGVSSGDETLHLMFDILLTQTWFPSSLELDSSLLQALCPFNIAFLTLELNRSSKIGPPRGVATEKGSTICRSLRLRAEPVPNNAVTFIDHKNRDLEHVRVHGSSPKIVGFYHCSRERHLSCSKCPLNFIV